MFHAMNLHILVKQNQRNAQISYIISIIAPTCFSLCDHPQGAHRVHQCCHVQSPIHTYLQYNVKTEHCVMAQTPPDYHAVHTPTHWAH
jgi:hypothetical protein